jgi:K+-transporting ATPase ATPase C chain
VLLNLRRSIVASVVFLVLLGLVYPLLGTGLSQLAFAHQANGSAIANGSSLIGQTWSGPKWFQGRPDGSVLTTGPGGVLVSGTNQPGPRSAALKKAVALRAAQLKREGIIPRNTLVTPSGSLLDPDISPAAAYAQVDAVARARNLGVAAVRRLVAAHVHGRELGFLGAPYVDVLELNNALAGLG